MMENKINMGRELKLETDKVDEFTSKNDLGIKNEIKKLRRLLVNF
jgi:hypothetical protein